MKDLKRLLKPVGITILATIIASFTICVLTIGVFASQRLSTSVTGDIFQNPATLTKEAYYGIPQITMQLSELDKSGNFIYCGIDVAVFYDPDGDGLYEIYPDDRKVKRLLTTSTNFTINLGPTSDYEKGVKYKLAYRTLYVPIGEKQEPIVIANYKEKEGWKLLSDTLFIPSYFGNTADMPFIQHTERWDTNRERYNEAKARKKENELLRDADVFWSGERFEVYIVGTELLPGLAVYITNERSLTGDEYILTSKDFTETTENAPTGGAIYTSSLWSEDMIDRWGNFASKDLDFVIAVVSGPSILEAREVTVRVDNRDQYWRTTREY